MSCLLGFFAAVALSQSTDRQVEGLLLVTNDRPTVVKLRKAFNPTSKLSEYPSKFPEDRFYLAPWGRRSAILIDRTIPFLQVRTDEIEILKAMSTNLSADGTLDLKSLSTTRKEAVKRHLGRFLVDTGSALDEAAIAIDFANLYTIEGANGKSYTVHNVMDGEARAKRKEALQRRPYYSSASKEEVAKRLQAMEEANLTAESLSVQCYGVASQNLPEGLAECRTHLDKIIREILLQRDNVARDAALKAGLTAGRGGKRGFDTLTKEEKENLLSSFVGGWQANGFADPESARQYAEGIRSVQTGKSILLSILYSAGPR